MSEETVQNTEAVETTETQQEQPVEKLAGKFNNVDDLVSGYKNLETKLGERISFTNDMQENDFMTGVKDMFGKMDAESGLENDLFKNISNDLRKDTGIPTKLTDLAVAKTAERVLEQQSYENKKQINELLQNAETKAAVRSGIDQQEGGDRDQLLARLESGEMSPIEVRLLAKLGEGAEVEESNSGILTEKSSMAMTVDQAADELNNLLDYKGHIWTNEKHPEYVETRKRIETLKKFLDI